MNLFLMADADYDEFKRLESQSLSIDASAIFAAKKEHDALSIDGNVATIKVNGMLTPERIGFLDFFGKPQTVWGDISAQANDAIGKGVDTIVLETDSGGGRVDGMFEAMDAIRDLDVNVVGRVVGQAQSAAYMLLTQADRIEASKPYNMIGSVGVKVGIPDSKEISNSDSPNKTADAVNVDGKPAVQETLDDLYAQITPRMAAGRNTTIDDINARWGGGATMTAKTALSRGMIDMINDETKPAGRSGVTKGKNMDINQLKAEHPDLYASVLVQGKELGMTEFKKLAAGHAKAAEISGDTKRALEDISAGRELDMECNLHHLAVAQKRTMIDNRGDESPPPVGDGKDPQANGADDESKLVAAYEAAGLEVEL